MLAHYFRVLKIPARQFSSALYITGDKAQKRFAVLSPVIDFDARLEQKQLLTENIKLRKLAIDIDKIEERWRFFKEVDNRKAILEQTRTEIGQNIANLMKLKDPKVAKEIDLLKTHLKIVKEDLKDLRQMSYGIEEGAALQVLNLPNVLHPKTPKAEELEVYRYLEKTYVQSDSHLEIGKERGYFKFINSMSCYLKSDAALFEYSIQNYFSDELVNLKYFQLSNSDFVKSIVAEGCGTDPYKSAELMTLEDIHCVQSDEFNKLHLVGASSLYSFMAFFTKHWVQNSIFPIKSFCAGRKYQVVEKNSPKSLFHLNQSSNVGLFIASSEDSDLFENVLNDVTILYKQLGYHFRIILVPAQQLNKAESLRASIQMFSNNLLSYVEVGNISFYQDYLSKRLLFTYSENGERKYPNVISGNLINIQKVIGCVVENYSVQEKPLMNEFLSKYLFR